MLATLAYSDSMMIDSTISSSTFVDKDKKQQLVAN